MNGSFFLNFPHLSQNGLKFKKILEKLGDWAYNWSDWYMNVSLFLEKLVFVWVFFQILQLHIPTETKLEYPPRAAVNLPNWTTLKLKSHCVGSLKLYCFNMSAPKLIHVNLPVFCQFREIFSLSSVEEHSFHQFQGSSRSGPYS